MRTLPSRAGSAARCRRIAPFVLLAFRLGLSAAGPVSGALPLHALLALRSVRHGQGLGAAPVQPSGCAFGMELLLAGETAERVVGGFFRGVTGPSG